MVALELDAVALTYPVTGGAGGEISDAALAARNRFVRDRRGRPTGFRALDGVTLQLGRGDRLAVLGRNGAGKTSLLRVMAGIVSPTGGAVRRAGRTTNLINIGLGMVDDATGHRNITLRGLALGRSRAEVEARRDAIAAFSELGEFLDVPVRTYSAGMRMRLNFAIATAFDPEILILDEWVSAGDAAFRQKAAERMRGFADRAGILVLASHNLALLRDVCDKAVLLDGGRVAEAGPVGPILDAYAAGATSSAAAEDD